MPATGGIDLQLIELFSSLQGEGTQIGRRELFLRLAGCNLDCGYCDTPFQPGPTWQFQSPGSDRATARPNPASQASILEAVDAWENHAPGLHVAINLTGGEPLVQGDALKELLPALSRRLPVHLETNGTLAEPLVPLLPFCAFLSVDLKLSAGTGFPTPWSSHRDFLRAGSSVPGQVKVVVGPMQDETELQRAAELVAETVPGYPLVLQPQTVDARPAITGDRLLELQQLCARTHRQTLVIPQVHPLLQLA